MGRRAIKIEGGEDEQDREEKLERLKEVINNRIEEMRKKLKKRGIDEKKILEIKRDVRTASKISWKYKNPGFVAEVAGLIEQGKYQKASYFIKSLKTIMRSPNDKKEFDYLLSKGVGFLKSVEYITKKVRKKTDFYIT